MNLSHLVTCCILRWEVVAEQTTFFLSAPFRLAEGNKNSSSDYMKYISAIPKIIRGLSKLHLMES